MANEFLVQRVVSANFPVLASNATQGLTSGVIIPKGALVTGVTMVNTGAITIANASGSIDLRVGTNALISTVMIKAAASAQTIPYVATLVSSAGTYLPAGGELQLSVQATSGTAVHTYAPDIYVGYLHM